MRKKLLFLLLALSLCLSLHVTALAHPGNTSDDDGGHIDNSTGEYHYHHGYSAHSHYDMDGDGDIDCPYDFIDKTNHDSHNNGSSPSESNTVVSQEIKSLPLGLLIGLVVIITFSVLSDFLLHKLAGTRFVSAEIVEDILYKFRHRLKRQNNTAFTVSHDNVSTTAEIECTFQARSESPVYDVILSEELSVFNSLALLSQEQISFIDNRLRIDFSHETITFGFNNRYSKSYSPSELWELYTLSLLEQKYALQCPSINSILPQDYVAKNSHDSSYYNAAKITIAYFERYRVPKIALYYACKFLTEYNFSGCPSVFAEFEMLDIVDKLFSLNAYKNSNYYFLFDTWISDIVSFGNKYLQ